MEIKKPAEKGSNTKIALPKELQGNNLIIEVNS